MKQNKKTEDKLYGIMVDLVQAHLETIPVLVSTHRTMEEATNHIANDTKFKTLVNDLGQLHGGIDNIYIVKLESKEDNIYIVKLESKEDT